MYPMYNVGSSSSPIDLEKYLNNYADRFLDGIDTTRPFGKAWKREIINAERQTLYNRTQFCASAICMYIPNTRIREYAILESDGTGDYLSQFLWDGEEAE